MIPKSGGRLSDKIMLNQKNGVTQRKTPRAMEN
jgi:hypothetical protein